MQQNYFKEEQRSTQGASVFSPSFLQAEETAATHFVSACPCSRWNPNTGVEQHATALISPLMTFPLRDAVENKAEPNLSLAGTHRFPLRRR